MFGLRRVSSRPNWSPSGFWESPCGAGRGFEVSGTPPSCRAGSALPEAEVLPRYAAFSAELPGAALPSSESRGF